MWRVKRTGGEVKEKNTVSREVLRREIKPERKGQIR